MRSLWGTEILMFAQYKFPITNVIRHVKGPYEHKEQCGIPANDYETNHG
jgi:hypothetical protein